MADLAAMKKSWQGTLWRMCIYYILFEACDLINQLAKKLVSLLAISPTACVKARSKEQNLLSP